MALRHASEAGRPRAIQTLNRNSITMDSHFDQWFEWPLGEVAEPVDGVFL
jgi:hypothetical protein